MSSWGKGPFGPLNPVHEHIMRNAEDIQPAALVWWAVGTAPLVGQAWFILAPNTRPVRAALAAAGVSLLTHAFMSYRFLDPHKNLMNNFFGFVWLYIIIKYVEWGMLEGPIVDPWMKKGRSRPMAAIDLLFNVRNVYLGSIGLDNGMGPPNATVKDIVVASHLPRPWRPLPRWLTILRHLYAFGWRILGADVIYAMIERVGKDTICYPGGMPGGGAVDSFVTHTAVTMFPGTQIQYELPSLLLTALVCLVVPAVIWLQLGWIYHLLAAVCVSSGLWEVSSWDVPIFDSPLRLDSIMAFWGRRWHGVVRHEFTILSVILERMLFIPAHSLLRVTLVYLISAAFHIVGQLSMDPVPDPTGIAMIFILSAVGCGLELSWKRVTGQRVEGFLGRLWVYPYMIWAVRAATDGWIDAGFLAGPPFGMGRVVNDWLTTWMYHDHARSI